MDLQFQTLSDRIGRSIEAPIASKDFTIGEAITFVVPNGYKNIIRLCSLFDGIGYLERKISSPLPLPEQVF